MTIEQKLDRLDREATTLEEDLDILESVIERDQAEIKALQRRVKANKDRANTLKQDIADINREYKRLEKTL
jgi:predicted  nucleic acid-binding Zn-ribbon protein